MGRKLVVGVLVLVVGALCLVASSSQAAVVAVSTAHVTVDVPVGWTYDRNYSDAGTTYDLYIESPGGVLSGVIGFFAHTVQSEDLNTEELWNELQVELEGLGYIGYTYIVAPRNITIGGLPASDATISIFSGMITLYSRVTVAYSADWHYVYMFIFAGTSDSWSTYSSGVDSFITSLEVEEKAGGDSSMLYIAIGAIVVVVVIVVVLLLVMRRKKQEPTMFPPPSAQAPPPTTQGPPAS